MLKMIETDHSKIYATTKYGKYPTIYIAVRSGHYEITDILLKMGTWDFKEDRSTPMHCAAYYGHYNLVSLLLSHNIPLNIKNYCGHLPSEETATGEIARLFKEASEDPVAKLFQQLYKDDLAVNHIEIHDKSGQIVCKKAILKDYMKYPQYTYKTWRRAFHGTRK